MSISGTGLGNSWSGWVPQTLTKIHDDLNAKSAQLASGKIASTNSGLGGNVYQTLDLQSRLSASDMYADSIVSVGIDLTTSINALSAMSDAANNTKNGPLAAINSSDTAGRSSRQTQLKAVLTSLLGYVNNRGVNGYIFGGSNTSAPPAEDVDTILNGDASTAKDGLSKLVTERQSADLGSDGLGRMAIAGSGTQVTLTSPASTLPFGMSIKNVASTFSHGSVALSGTTPSTMTADFATGLPHSGETVTITLNLPDGTTTPLVMTAGTSNANGTFAIGTTAADTATNFQAALTTTLKQVANVQLFNASAAKQSTDFFTASTTNPPQRIVPGPDGTFQSATVFSTDTQANGARTIAWYNGTDANAVGDPRQDVSSRIGENVNIGLGVRGNEKGFAETLAAIAAAGVVTPSTTDETLANSQFSDLVSRSSAQVTTGRTDILSITASLSSAQSAVKSESSNQTSYKALLQQAFDSKTTITPEQAASELSALQTQLQVAYQVTSRLMKMSLADYL
jgi:flagellin-like hook-associated protein FlgL